MKITKVFYLKSLELYSMNWLLLIHQIFPHQLLLPVWFTKVPLLNISHVQYRCSKAAAAAVTVLRNNSADHMSHTGCCYHRIVNTNDGSLITSGNDEQLTFVRLQVPQISELSFLKAMQKDNYLSFGSSEISR